MLALLYKCAAAGPGGLYLSKVVTDGQILNSPSQTHPYGAPSLKGLARYGPVSYPLQITHTAVGVSSKIRNALVDFISDIYPHPCTVKYTPVVNSAEKLHKRPRTTAHSQNPAKIT
jgi:hypothetical protein